eukprot:CAMPEP_0182418840 /NCGR_PEP_ID=MMETSP1167-20130531/3217_1 /TAXON_ID=2988 /ORGANISM="Mallomonas Sp, Strain CCMP3275" /LENGTH=349 /DNA_ID=CAMNT_0024593269 /DNA_START=886 /DNA_END=1936 /DNA_ORIENTATION=+
MAFTPNAELTYWYADDFIPWITGVASHSSPPLVHSLSYGIEEEYVSQSDLKVFDQEALKLLLMGVTIVAASGDDGANSRDVRDYYPYGCGYSPTWPASCPYVLSVGGTMGVESNTEEIVCMADDGGITSGGGFSDLYYAPDYQKAAVDTYFNTIRNKGISLKSGYTIDGRAYPDIAMSAAWYDVVIAGKHVGVSGTSAATPVIASFISLVNGQRLAAGQPPVGYINPILYSSRGIFANDITKGDNKCSGEEGKCCSHGFSATEGWDPVTGWGSVDFVKFAQLLHPRSHGEERERENEREREDKEKIESEGVRKEEKEEEEEIVEKEAEKHNITEEEGEKKIMKRERKKG